MLIVMVTLIIAVIYAFLYFRVPNIKRAAYRVLINDRLNSSMTKLYGQQESINTSKKYIDEKVRLCLIIVICGLILSSVLAVYSRYNPIVNDENEILREGYRGLDKTVTLTVENEDRSLKEKVTVDISHRVYSDKKTEEMATGIINSISEIILNGNSSTDKIMYPMKLPTAIGEYPIKLSWRSDKPLIIGRDGQIDYDRLEKELEKECCDSIMATLILTLSYEEYEEELEIPISVTMPPRSTSESFIKDITETIEEINEDTKEAEYIRLPQYVNDARVYFEEEKGKTYVLILILTAVSAIAVYYAKDNEIRKKIELKYEELEADYPRIVNQYALYYCAGMHTKSIWHEICQNYLENLRCKKTEKRYVFEEMVKQDIRMSEGIGELRAYEEFSRNITLRSYRSFISIVEQSLEKGRDGIVSTLNKEADSAQRERLDRARMLGEKAGTRILLPMFMMLSVVLIIVIFPAFVSFQI